MSKHGRSGQVGAGFLGWLTSQWKRLPEGFRWNIEDTFQPEDIAERLLPKEEPQLEIRLAWYRDIIGIIVFDYFRWIFSLTMLITAVVVLFAYLRGYNLILGAIPILILIGVVIIGIRERIEYNQWRLLKTNARFIISIPQHNSFPLVDNIELKGLPTVLDTNWSKNPFWRIFQFFTGARDLHISLAAYQFAEGTARVRDALIIPDVMPKHVYELRKLVFRIPMPQRVVFASPQKVIVTEEED